MTRNDSAYESGERVFGPPVGTFDVEWVARDVERRTGTTLRDAQRGVAAAWLAARRSASLEHAVMTDAATAEGLPPETAQTLVAQIVAYCTAYDVDPAAR
jgi:hypothetical protein